MSGYCSKGELASGGGVGGAGQRRSCRAAVAASCWLAGDVARAAGFVGCRRGHGALAMVGHGLESVRGETRRLGRTCVLNARSGRAQSTHETCSTNCQSLIQSLGDVAATSTRGHACG